MNNTVVVEYMGIPHFSACCANCKWAYEDYRDRRKGFRKTREHVRITGHTIYIEKGIVTKYSPG